MSDTPKIDPALTPEEWTEMRGAGDLIGRPYYYSGIVQRSAIAGMPEMGIALLNDLLPDDDRRKITRAWVEALRAVTQHNPDTLPGYGVPLRQLADALESYLPPES